MLASGQDCHCFLPNLKTDLISLVRYDTNIESIECLHFNKIIQFNTIRICDKDN